MKLSYGSVAQPGMPYGYGMIGTMLQKALSEEGVTFVNDFTYDMALVIGLPWPWLLGRQHRSDVVFHTMYEATPLPPDWATILNRCRGIWAPSRWVADLFVKAGVTQPVLVGGYGVNTDLFRPASRRNRSGPYRVLAWGRGLLSRKNLLMAARVFDAAGLPDAQMEIKVNADDATAREGPIGLDNVSVRKADWGITQLVDWLHSGDVLLYLSGGEGFGLMPLEAMATGLPVICAANTGMLDYLSEDTALLVPCYENTGDPSVTDRLYETRFGHKARFMEPDYEAAVTHLRRAYYHRDEAAMMGERAALMVASNWTWRDAGRKAKALLETFYTVTRLP